MTIFTCADTFEAMMTCIYTAWDSKLGHKNIKLQTEPYGNLELFCDYIHVDADIHKSQKVIRTIQTKLSFRAYQMVFRCAMADANDKLDHIYRFLLLGFAYPKEITNMFGHPIVMPVFELNRKVTNEAHLFRELLRFHALPNQVLIAHLEPHSNILTMLAPHFEDRMPSENWMIIDDLRRLSLIHPADEAAYLTFITEDEFLSLKESEKSPDPFIDLWGTFFHSIAITQRKNPICQRNHMPLWYRKHLTEFHPADF